MTNTLYYAGQPGDGYGWGVCNKYLIRELSKLCDLKHWPQSSGSPENVFVPIADHSLTPSCSIRGKRNYGYCFFEFELQPDAVENAKLYDLIFCGSTWCKERLAERGIHNTEVLIQGVDHDIFQPDERARVLMPPDEFRIFSGGKFEYRKGQDIVLAAFKLLQDKYPDMHLVASWFNPWPQLFYSMKDSKHISLGFPYSSSAMEWLKNCAIWNGLHKDRLTLLPQLSQNELADVMRSTDLGVFPNRCEGGTNLVLMEYLACGKPAIATAGTGHLDICGYDKLIGKETDTKWVECSPEQVASRIEYLYGSHKLRNPSGEWGPAFMREWTWQRAAEQILSHC